MTDSSADKSLFSLAQIQHLMRVEFNRAQRYGYPISCIMVAVDRLGHLRDLYGYEAKEEIVDSVISLLANSTAKATDARFPSRWRSAVPTTAVTTAA